jgi:4,5-DOPA dioxygenase extradiol
MTGLMPTIFFGHANPMNAIRQKAYTESWSVIGQAIPQLQAELAIAVTVNSAPRTIHDFGGFPQELYEVEYPAPGRSELTRRIKLLLSRPC